MNGDRTDNSNGSVGRHGGGRGASTIPYRSSPRANPVTSGGDSGSACFLDGSRERMGIGHEQYRGFLLFVVSIGGGDQELGAVRVLVVWNARRHIVQ